MADRIRVGVVGLGSFGGHHARHYAANPGATLVVVADADGARASAGAEKYGAQAASDHRGLIGKVDAASVTVPASFHHRVAGELIDAGIHVFVEKPLAVAVEEAADLVVRSARAAVILQVGHIERFSPAFRALAERVSAPRTIECNRSTPWTGRNADVDVVLDLMIHDIDLALALVRSPVVSVEASGESVMTPWNDTAEARLTFANGAVATLMASRVATSPARTAVVTEAGKRYAADLGGPSLTVISGEGAAALVEAIPLAPGDNLGAEIAGFLESVRTGHPPLVDGRAGLDAVRVADMILAAIAGRRVSAPSRLQRST